MHDRATQLPSTVAGLGDPIGLGRTAEVFAYGDGEVVKLIQPGFPDRLGENEAEVAALVARAGVAAPAFMGTTRIEDASASSTSVSRVPRCSTACRAGPGRSIA